MSFMYSSTRLKSLKKIDYRERPRERIINGEIEGLDNVELMAAILGSGIKGRDVISLSNEILELVINNYDSLSFELLKNVKGLGMAKSCQVMAIIELAKRFSEKNGARISSCEDVLLHVHDLRYRRQEHFVSLTINGAGRMIKRRVIFKGTVNQSLAHPRESFLGAISDRASSIIFVHNHPSGTSRPSREDRAVTKRLVDAGKLLGIEVLDHIILGTDSYFSFKEEGFF